MIRVPVAALVFCIACPGASFEAASVKASRSAVGRDGTIAVDPIRFSARNATLKRLIFEAYQIPYSQITGGPKWIESDEFDIDAKAETPTTPEELKLMLRVLLEDRFKLAVHTETKVGRVYVLVVGKDGPRLGRTTGTWQFHGTLGQFADRLSTELAIPFLTDPTVPSHPSGPPVPVVDKTGLGGEYDIGLDLKPEPGSDPFTFWQRVLGDKLGLKLESHPLPVEILVVDHAERPSPSGG